MSNTSGGVVLLSYGVAAHRPLRRRSTEGTDSSAGTSQRSTNSQISSHSNTTAPGSGTDGSLELKLADALAQDDAATENYANKNSRESISEA